MLKVPATLATILLAASVAFAQYTPGTGGTYTPPQQPTPPRPVQPTPPSNPTYSWETPPGYQPNQPQPGGYQPQPQPQLVPVQPEGVRIVQPQSQYIEISQGVYVPRLGDAQLGDLTAAIALYPDPLLAEILPASTFVEQLCYADRWLAQHPGADEGSIAALPVHPSVRTLMHFPTVLNQMTDHLDWTQALGMAFVYQRHDVMESIQRWRFTAVASGTLYSTQQQDVLRQGNQIIIIPPQRAQVIYVPVYDPTIVYAPPSIRRPTRDFITFNVAGLSIRWIQNDVDWRERQVRVPVRDDRDDRDGRGPGPGRGGAEPRTAFVREARPEMTYPQTVAVPQPDKKVIKLPVLPNRGNPGRGDGRGNNPGRGRGPTPF